MYKNCFNINKLKSAFTLAEIMVTLTVIGIIAGITIPNFVKRESVLKIFEVGKCIHFIKNFCKEKIKWRYYYG